MFKIDFFIIAFEAEKYLKACIEQILPHANKIIIAEGAVQIMAEQKGYFRSSDNTLNIIKKFDKIDLIQITKPWKDKTEMKNAILNYLNGDIIWQIDYDEFYTHNDIEKIRMLFKADIDIVYFKAFHFWKDCNYYRVGGKWDYHNLRIFRRKGDIQYKVHNILYRNGISYTQKNFKSLNIGRIRYHYGYVENYQHIQDKIKFMSIRDLHRRDDYISNLIEWKNNEILDDSKVIKYLGKHPEEIQKMIDRGELK